MSNESISISPEVGKAFIEYDRKAKFNNFKVACYLGIVLMPVGVALDYFVYRKEVGRFFELRMGCSALIALFLGVALTPLGQKYHRFLGVLLALLPAFTISWMIYLKDGATSPYYAGLNLVLLVIGFVLSWTFMESFSAVSLVFLMYIGACFLHGNIQKSSSFFNNMYFLVLTGIIVVTGSYFHTKLRLREFILRFELDQNRQMLEETNQKLLELDQVKSRFFANISHELRTPLTLLLAPLEMMLNRFQTAFNQETRELLLTMRSNGMRLLKLINDLLDLVRLESGRMEVRQECLPVSEFLKGLANSAKQVANDKRVLLECSVDPDLGEVLADRDKLEKILLNLLFNALKFTPAGGRVDLRAQKQESELVLMVEDTGMGISEKNLPHVFDRFWQADDSSKRKYQGVGIGLALVKELVEIQGGKVSVQSQEGKGTLFTVRLPYQTPEEKPRASSQAPIEAPSSDRPEDSGTVSSEEWLANLYRRAELFPALTPLQETLRPEETSLNGSHPKVLVADDEPDMLRFLKSQLRRDYQVLEAVDGQQAIEKASQFLPDIILLDMMMPEKDGLQVCRELRERAPTQGIPIILLTARADEETKLAALSAGASDFLSKPFSTTELHVRIKNLVESHQYQQKLAKQNQVLEITIDQLKETETQLVQTEKLASLGRLSAGIIHEINNPLNFATTGLFTLRNKEQYLLAEQRADFAEIVHDVEEGINRVKTIVSDLRSFTRQDNEQLDDVAISEAVSTALRFLSTEWRHKVKIVQEIAEDQTISANKNKFIQVLINILQNSLDALRKKSEDTGEPTIWINGSSDAGKNRISIRDNGEGIELENMDKIFDPFFTTKDVGEGMGLGLSICYRIVEGYHGQISVKSEPGKFCEFTLEFPMKAPEQNSMEVID